MGLQNAACVQDAALLDRVSVHLVEQGPQAHAKPFRRLAAVATTRRESPGDRVALGGLDRLTERTAPRSPLPLGVRCGERFLPKIPGLQDRKSVGWERG